METRSSSSNPSNTFEEDCREGINVLQALPLMRSSGTEVQERLLRSAQIALTRFISNPSARAPPSKKLMQECIKTLLAPSSRALPMQWNKGVLASVLGAWVAEAIDVPASCCQQDIAVNITGDLNAEGDQIWQIVMTNCTARALNAGAGSPPPSPLGGSQEESQPQDVNGSGEQQLRQQQTTNGDQPRGNSVGNSLAPTQESNGSVTESNGNSSNGYRPDHQNDTSSSHSAVDVSPSQNDARAQRDQQPTSQNARGNCLVSLPPSKKNIYIYIYIHIYKIKRVVRNRIGSYFSRPCTNLFSLSINFAPCTLCKRI